MKKLNKLLDKCPVCGDDLMVSGLRCSNCRTDINGAFEITSSPLSRLNSEQMNFVLTFIQCEGKFNRMEEELNLSYPTLRSRFNEILKVMGFEAEESDNYPSTEERKEILTLLNNGKITIEEAQERLRGKPVEK